MRRPVEGVGLAAPAPRRLLSCADQLRPVHREDGGRLPEDGARRMMIRRNGAAVVFELATDRLHYAVGDDARGFVKRRREYSWKEYIAFMRQQFR